MRIFESDMVEEVDYDCDSFKILFEEEVTIVDADKWSILMWFCSYCPQLFDSGAWFTNEILKLTGFQDLEGETALMKLFKSDTAGEIDFE